MITDVFFQQGTTHEVCEDYGLRGSDYVIISDGCSNGGGPHIDSDWGSRILCKAAEQHLQDFADKSRFISAISATAKTQCHSFPNLSIECLTATFLMLKAFEDNCHALIIGDGVTGGQKHNGEWQITDYTYLPGGSSKRAAPFYLKYMMEHEIEKYIEIFGGKLSRTTYSGDLQNLELISVEELEFNPELPWHIEIFDKSEFKFCFIGTDGLNSFSTILKTATSKSTKSIDLPDILKIIFDIPQFRPDFLRIQRNWAF